MDLADLLEYDEQVQDQLEGMYPAELQVEAGPAIPCAGGNMVNADTTLGIAGFGAATSMSFRVRKSAFAAPPEIGHRLQWRRAGEADWRPTVRVMRVADPQASVAYFLGCDDLG